MGKDSLDPQLSTTVRVLNQFFYARDIWQATRKLTIEYGVRFERYPYATTRTHGSVNYDAVTNTASIGGIGGVPGNAYVDTGIGQLLPRVGIAYRVDDKTVVRAGFGLNADPQNFWTELYIYPTIISASQVGSSSFTPAGSLATGLAPVVFPDLSTGKVQLPTSVTTDGNVPKYRVGYTESYNFTVQRDVGKGFNAQVAYVGTHGVRLLSDLNYNAAGPGQGVAGGAMYQKWGNPNPITQETPWQGGRYDSLQTQLTRRVADAQLGVIYTFSKAINWADNEITTSPAWNWGPVLGRNRALASYDRTHNFEIWSIYSLPFGHGQHYLTEGLGAAILGGWELTPILERISGTPFTVSSSGASLNAPGNAQTADQVVSNVAILGGHGPNSPYFDPNAFAPVSAVRFGSTGRNILRGPGVFVLNLGLVRNFRLKESLKLQFRAEAYSLTNTPNYGNPGGTVSNASFSNGQLTSYGGYDIISSSTGQRQIRFALKLTF